MTQKFLKLFSILALFFALFFISCSNENTTGSGNGELETPQTDTPTSKAFLASLPTAGTEIPASSGSSSSGGSSSMTYTFAANGDLTEIQTATYISNNTTYTNTYSNTYTFWGAKEEGRGIYYEKFNLQDYKNSDLTNLFPNLNPPNKNIYYYYGVTYGNNQLTMYGPSQDYETRLDSWWSNNTDTNSKTDVDWNSYPQQTTDEIDWTTPY